MEPLWHLSKSNNMDDTQKFIRQLRKWNWIVFGATLLVTVIIIRNNVQEHKRQERHAAEMAECERRLEQSKKDLEDLRTFNSWSSQYNRH